MIFLIDTYCNPKEITVYESIHQLTNMVEWQDILDKGTTIIDSEGKIYAWDNTKKSECATVYGYSMKVTATDVDLANRCIETYEKLKRPTEFLLFD